jgi:hypothetical protein
MILQRKILVSKALESSQKVVDSSPEYRVKNYQRRMLIGTPTTGTIRMEWAAARYGMVIPANYSNVSMVQYTHGFIPLRYTIADAQNMIVQEAVTKGYEFLLLIEHDTMPPPDALIRFNQYMRDKKYPVVSGLYFTRSDPAEPMIYRGRGSSYYTDWKLGDKVMADGVPTGMLLIDVRLLKDMWLDSAEYMAGQTLIRRVFDTPVKSWFNPETNSQETLVGTSDLDWCERIISGGYLKKHWPKLAKLRYPFLVDTNISCMHIEEDGRQFPLQGIQAWCQQNGNI